MKLKKIEKLLCGHSMEIATCMLEEVKMYEKDPCLSKNKAGLHMVAKIIKILNRYRVMK